jgi:hypothetical protein
MDEEQVRLYLRDILIVLYPGVPRFYRPPSDTVLTYPCIVYTPLQAEPSYANSIPYVMGTRFQVSLLSVVPGYTNPRAIFGASGIVITSNRSYTENDVVHDVFTLTVNKI